MDETITETVTETISVPSQPLDSTISPVAAAHIEAEIAHAEASQVQAEASAEVARAEADARIAEASAAEARANNSPVESEVRTWLEQMTERQSVMEQRQVEQSNLLVSLTEGLTTMTTALTALASPSNPPNPNDIPASETVTVPPVESPVAVPVGTQEQPRARARTGKDFLH